MTLKSRVRPEAPGRSYAKPSQRANQPKVAVAVLIQDAGVERNQISGAGLAAPIAKAVMQAVLGR